MTLIEKNTLQETQINFSITMTINIAKSINVAIQIFYMAYSTCVGYRNHISYVPYLKKAQFGKALLVSTFFLSPGIQSVCRL